MIALLPGAPIGEVFTLLPHPTNLVLAELAQVHWPAGAWLVVSLCQGRLGMGASRRRVNNNKIGES